MKLICNIYLNGVRQNPVYSGYRPSFRWDNKQTDCVITLLENDFIEYNGTVEIELLHPENVEGINIYDTFTLTEGLKEIGTGFVVKLA